MKKYVKVFNFIILFSLCLMLVYNTSYASEPKLMLASYETDKEVVAGEAFALKLTLRNTAKTKIRNLKVIISSENGELLPDNNAGTYYINEIEMEKDVEVDFDMLASYDLTEKNYRLTIKLEYEDIQGNSYNVDENIFIPVKLKQRFDVTGLYFVDTVKLGDELELLGQLNNLGGGTLYNVKLRVTGDHIDEMSHYVGNIESGKSVNIDILARSNHVTDGTGVDTIYVSYEDKAGNISEKKFEVKPVIESNDYSDLMIVKKASEKRIRKDIIYISVVVFLLILFIVTRIYKMLKKKKILEDFE